MKGAWLLAPVLLFSLACKGGGSNVSMEGGAGSSASVAQAGTGSQAAGAGIDVCAAVSAADLGNAVNRPIKEPRPSTNQCSYSMKDGAVIVWVLVLHGVHAGGSKQDAKAYLGGKRMPGAMQPKPANEIPGLGDEAILIHVPEMNEWEILARKGDSLVTMQTISSLDPKVFTDAARKVLPPLFAKL